MCCVHVCTRVCLQVMSDAYLLRVELLAALQQHQRQVAEGIEPQPQRLLRGGKVKNIKVKLFSLLPERKVCLCHSIHEHTVFIKTLVVVSLYCCAEIQRVYYHRQDRGTSLGEGKEGCCPQWNSNAEVTIHSVVYTGVLQEVCCQACSKVPRHSCHRWCVNADSKGGDAGSWTRDTTSEGSMSACVVVCACKVRVHFPSFCHVVG